MTMTKASLFQVVGLSALTSAVVSAVTLIAFTPVAPWATVPALQNSSSSAPAEYGSVRTPRFLGGPAPADLNPEDSPVVQVASRANAAVASVIISKDIPVIEQSFGGLAGYTRGTEKREIGGGTAFFVSQDGLLMTNKHVVDDPDAEYTVFLNDGRRLSAVVAGRDPSNDVALLKVSGTGYTALLLSERAQPLLGQPVIAIGNTLGEFRNTVSVGVISGLQRTIVAGGLFGGETEQLQSIIQTDAAINQGNSGGPLIDLRGQVVGMSTAVAGGDAQNVSFAIPAVDLRLVLDSYKEFGRIVRPYLGVRYVQVTADLQAAQKLGSDYGVLVIGGTGPGEPAIVPGSPAAKAGLREGDIVLEADSIKLTEDISLATIVQRKKPGSVLNLLVLQDGERKTLNVTLQERTES